MSGTSRGVALASVVGLFLVGCADQGGETEDAPTYPASTITFIVPFQAGGPTDVIGRVVATCLEDELGQTVVVENRPGAGGAVGMGELARAEPDGLTLGVGSVSTIVLSELFQPDANHSVDSFRYAGEVMGQAGVLAVPADSEYQSAEQLLQAAAASPGDISVAVPSGATGQNAIELRRLSDIYGIEVSIVPFEGEGPSLTALLGGEVDAYFTTLSDTLRQYVDEGQVELLAAGTPERVPYLDDVPTLAEVGYEELVNSNVFWTIAAPRETPDAVMETLEETLATCLDKPDVIEQLGPDYVSPEFVGGEEAAEALHDQRNVFQEYA